jgi:hypothetical protein
VRRFALVKVTPVTITHHSSWSLSKLSLYRCHRRCRLRLDKPLQFEVQVGNFFGLVVRVKVLNCRCRGWCWSFLACTATCSSVFPVSALELQVVSSPVLKHSCVASLRIMWTCVSHRIAYQHRMQQPRFVYSRVACALSASAAFGCSAMVMRINIASAVLYFL